MTFSLLLLGYLFSGALAAAETTGSITPRVDLGLKLRGDFLPAEEALPQMTLPPAVSQAVVSLKTEVDECGATYVSDRGHLLTAGHCLVQCLQQSGVYRLRRVSGPYAMIDVDQDALAAGEVSCPVRINEESVRMRVRAARYCQVFNSENAVPSAEERECLGRPDYAVLEPLPPAPAPSCLRVEPEFPMIGTRVGAAGYPAVTKWGELDPAARDSDGKSQYFSLGKVVNIDYCQIRDRDGDGPGRSRKVSIRDEKQLLMNFIQTDAGAVPGSSGGPLLNFDGRLLGVAHAISSAYPWQHYDCKGSFFITSFGEILRDLPRSVDLGTTFACDQRAAK